MAESFSDQLRRAIRESGMTGYAIAVKARVDTGALSKFLAGKVGLSLAAIERLVEALDLELRTRGKRRGKEG
jgi:transcriptional regulator with XRE-family HTH domain